VAYVYLHRKPCDNSIYYVGIGKSKHRPNAILGRSEQWTRTYNKYGRIVEIVASGIDYEQAKELEVFLIEEIGLDNLCNHTKGGDGTVGYKHKEESKRKMASVDKSYTKTPEYRENMSRIKKGIRHKGKELIQMSTGFVFDSMHHVADHLGLNRNRILSAFYWYRKGKPKRNIIKDFELL
jgi:hypothetical protein